MKRLPVIGVMGSGTKRYADRASRVGAWIARSGYHLLTGGGAGVMDAVAEAFVSISPRVGLAVGILPADIGSSNHRSPVGYPNPWVELVIQTHLPSRWYARRRQVFTQSSQCVVIRCDHYFARVVRNNKRSEAGCVVRAAVRRILSKWRPSTKTAGVNTSGVVVRGCTGVCPERVEIVEGRSYGVRYGLKRM